MGRPGLKQKHVEDPSQSPQEQQQLYTTIDTFCNIVLLVDGRLSKTDHNGFTKQAHIPACRCGGQHSHT
jgi:hypothetical protein